MMSLGSRDPYELLGVPRQASASDISRAYRRAARATHPDSQPGDPSAAERFKHVTDAYETLSDPGRRSAYDRAHPDRPAASRLRVEVRSSAPPVRLGAPQRRRHAFEPLRPDDDLLELAAALSRLLRSRWLWR